MNQLRKPGEPGRNMPAMNHICGFDGRDSSAPVCGAPAIFHIYAGSPTTGPSDYTMLACEEHSPQAMKYGWDWHEIAAVCDIPGTIWQARGKQGEGFCYWPEAEVAMQETLSREMADS